MTRNAVSRNDAAFRALSIERLQKTFEDRGDVMALYAYLGHAKEPLSWRDILAALITQFVENNEATCSSLKFYRQPQSSCESLCPIDLAETLQALIAKLDKVFIAIDGLEEVDDDTKVRALRALESLGCNLLIASRPLDLFTHFIAKAIHATIVARPEDIDMLVRHAVQENPRLQATLREKPDALEKLSKLVQEKAEGMCVLPFQLSCLLGLTLPPLYM